VTEIRPLRIHDLPFVYRVAGLGVNFDAQLSLTVGEDALRHALMTSMGRMQAYILRRSSGSVFGQLHYLESDHHARLANVAPALEDGGDAALWLELLEGLIVMAGQRGVVTLIAEVGVNAPEFTVLRRAGFATYTRQELWVRPPCPVEPPPAHLHPVATPTGNGLLSLYGSLVPGLIKHVEPPLAASDNHYILPERRGAAGMVIVHEGPHADLIEIYISPQAETSPYQLVQAALATVDAERRTVYCRVRDYMGCPGSALAAAAGFQPVATQAAMYRQTAVRVQPRTNDASERVEGGIPLPTSIVDTPPGY